MPHAKFVDPATVLAVADQKGTDEAPFVTIQQAVTALEAVGGGAILLAPGSYPEETITPAIRTPLTLRGLSVEDGAPVDCELITINSQDALSIIDVFIFGDLTYADHLWVQNSEVQNAVLSAAATGSATFINSNANQLECSDEARITDGNVAQLSCAGSCFLTRANATASLVCGGNLVIDGVPVQGSIPSATTVDLTVTAVGYQLDALTCFRYQWLESCQLSGNCVVTSPEAMPMKNCAFSPACNIDGPAGAILEMDGNTYSSFLTQGCTLSGGIAIKVVDQQQRITLAIAVPVLAAGVSAYVDTSLVGTDLAGMSAGDPVLVNPQQDVEAAGANGGGLRSFRISAGNTLRCEFQGVTTAGSQNFTVTKL